MNNINPVYAAIFSSIFFAQETSRKNLSELAEDAIIVETKKESQ